MLPCPTRALCESDHNQMMVCKTTLALVCTGLALQSSHARQTMLRGLQQHANSTTTPTMAPAIADGKESTMDDIYCRYTVTAGATSATSQDKNYQQCLVYDETTHRITDIVRIELPPMFVVAHQGELMRGPMLRITGATIVDGRVVWTDRSNITIVRRRAGGSGAHNRWLHEVDDDDHEHHDVKFGTKLALAVRVMTPYGEEGATFDTMRGVVLGNGGPEHDAVNFRSQYYDCSFGQLDIQPALGNGIQDGVLNVTVDVHPEECDVTRRCQVLILNAIEDTLGTSLDDFDMVLIAMPLGTIKEDNDDWIAFAYFNRNLAFFQGEQVTRLSNVMHEVGHILGLGHAYYHDDVYADTTGMMGYSDRRVAAPKSCFNPAMYHALGWMADTEFKVEFEDAADGPDGGYAVRLVAFVDKQNLNVRADDKTLLQVDEDVFIAYNHAHGMNAETRIFLNAVTVVEDRDTRNSELLAALTTDETQDYYRSAENSWPHFAIVRGGIVVEVCDMGRDVHDIDFAIVAVWDIKRGHQSPCPQALQKEAEQQDVTLRVSHKNNNPALKQQQQQHKCENFNYWVFVDDPDRWRIPCHEVASTPGLCDTLVDHDGTLAREICMKSCEQC